MTFVELRSLMASQIFAGLVSKEGVVQEDFARLAKQAVDSAKTIEDEVAKQQTPKRERASPVSGGQRRNENPGARPGLPFETCVRRQCAWRH